MIVQTNSLKITFKFNRWTTLFLDANNKEGFNTYGNQTRSALIAYGLNEETQYYSAGVIGRENYKKLKTLACTYLAGQGITYGYMLDVAVEKMRKSDSPQWWDRIAKLIGMDVEDKAEVNTVINNNQVMMKSISKQDQLDWNAKFKQFLEQDVNSAIEIKD